MKKDLAIFLLLVVLCAIVTALNPRFLSPANLQNTARLIGAFGIFSLGLGLVIITGGIDLSVGSSFALLGVLLSMMLTEWHLPGRWPSWSIVGSPRCSARFTVCSSRDCGFSRLSSRSAGCSSIAAREVHCRRRDEGFW